MAKDQLSNQTPYLVIVAVVAVVAVVSLVLNGGGSVQGAAVICTEGNTGTGDINMKQHVVLPNGEKVYDRCSSDGNYVYEVNCATSKVAGNSGPIPCTNGCENGACFGEGQNPYN